MPYLQDWEEAARLSRYSTAVAKFPRKVQDRNGEWVIVDIVKKAHRNGYLVYKQTMLKVRDATTKEVDQTTGWKPW